MFFLLHIFMHTHTHILNMMLRLVRWKKGNNKKSVHRITNFFIYNFFLSLSLSVFHSLINFMPIFLPRSQFQLQSVEVNGAKGLMFINKNFIELVIIFLIPPHFSQCHDAAWNIALTITAVNNGTRKQWDVINNKHVSLNFFFVRKWQ
jgi:hypothetical protein